MITLIYPIDLVLVCSRLLGGETADVSMVHYDFGFEGAIFMADPMFVGQTMQP